MYQDYFARFKKMRDIRIEVNELQKTIHLINSFSILSLGMCITGKSSFDFAEAVDKLRQYGHVVESARCLYNALVKHYLGSEYELQWDMSVSSDDISIVKVDTAGLYNSSVKLTFGELFERMLKRIEQ